MSMQDPISDMLSCIRNGQITKKYSVSMFSSKIKEKIACLLMKEGYITNYEVVNHHMKPVLTVILKYFQNKPVIEHIQRISRPSLRVYKKKNALPKVMSGMGIAIISTSKGILSDKKARKLGVGGEIVCYVA